MRRRDVVDGAAVAQGAFPGHIVSVVTSASRWPLSRRVVLREFRVSWCHLDHTVVNVHPARGAAAFRLLTARERDELFTTDEKRHIEKLRRQGRDVSWAEGLGG